MFMSQQPIHIRRLALASCLAMGLYACVKNSNTPVVTPGVTSITGFVKGSPTLSLLDSSMSKAGLLPTFDSLSPISVAGPFTFFAPLNIAFAVAGYTDSTLYYSTRAQLDTLVLYHTIAGQKSSLANFMASLQSPNTPVPSAVIGDTLYLTYNSRGLFVNGNLVTQSDLFAGNGLWQTAVEFQNHQRRIRYSDQ